MDDEGTGIVDCISKLCSRPQVSFRSINDGVLKRIGSRITPPKVWRRTSEERLRGSSSSVICDRENSWRTLINLPFGACDKHLQLRISWQSVKLPIILRSGRHSWLRTCHISASKCLGVGQLIDPRPCKHLWPESSYDLIGQIFMTMNSTFFRLQLRRSGSFDQVQLLTLQARKYHTVAQGLRMAQGLLRFRIGTQS